MPIPVHEVDTDFRGHPTEQVTMTILKGLDERISEDLFLSALLAHLHPGKEFSLYSTLFLVLSYCRGGGGGGGTPLTSLRSSCARIHISSTPPPPPSPLGFSRCPSIPFKTTRLEMTGLNVVMWNSGGLRAAAPSTAQKMAFFDKEFPEANFSVAAFLETHHKNEDDFPDLINEYCTVASYFWYTSDMTSCILKSQCPAGCSMCVWYIRLPNMLIL